MKRARVAYAGAVFDAFPHADGLKLSDGRIVSEDAVVWLPPVAKPGTIFALGLNYADHAKELAFKAPDEPLAFLKGPNTLLGHKGVTRMPAGVVQMHYECELTAVIGRGGKHIARADALAHVAGYTVANDYAIREYLENYYRPNLRVKNRDGCTPKPERMTHSPPAPTVARTLTVKPRAVPGNRIISVPINPPT